MGCDIHSFTEQLDAITEKWKFVKWQRLGEYDHAPFDWRQYGMYGFLADVRNYSHVPVIAQPRGIPKACSHQVAAELERWYGDGHSYGWLTVDELVSYNYDQTFENRRYSKTVGNVTYGAAIAEVGSGKQTTIRDFLGEFYFKHLKQLEDMNSLHNTRIVFWFDN